MSQRLVRSGLLAAIGLILLLGSGACSSPSTLRSHTMTQPLSVDGSLNDWAGSLSYVDDQSSVSMSVARTDSLLYVAVALQDRQLIRSVAMNGLVVWIDPSGKQRHNYGIRYPLGLRKQRADRQRTNRSQPSSPPPTSVEDVALSELDIVRGETHRRVPAHHTSGLRAHATLAQGSLIYELAIPVGTSASDAPAAHHTYGLRTPINGPIGVGLETPQPDDEDVNLPSTQGTPSVTGPPRRGRSPRGGRRRGRRRRHPPSQQRPDLPVIDVWTTVVPNR